MPMLYGRCQECERYQNSCFVLVWNWLYQPGFGLINSYLAGIGLAEVNWLGQPGVAMVSAVIATVW